MSKQMNIPRTAAKGDKPLPPEQFLETMPALVSTQPATEDKPAKRVKAIKVVKVAKAEAAPTQVQPVLPPPPEKEREARLTLEIPFSLHRQIKMSCVERGTTIKDEILALLKQYYRPQKESTH